MGARITRHWSGRPSVKPDRMEHSGQENKGVLSYVIADNNVTGPSDNSSWVGSFALDKDVYPILEHD